MCAMIEKFRIRVRSIWNCKVPTTAPICDSLRDPWRLESRRRLRYLAVLLLT